MPKILLSTNKNSEVSQMCHLMVLITVVNRFSEVTELCEGLVEFKHKDDFVGLRGNIVAWVRMTAFCYCRGALLSWLQ